MAIYVKVYLDGPDHGKAGEIVGFSSDAEGEDVLVALEDGQLATFHPSVLWRVGFNQGFFKRLAEEAL